MAAEVVWSDAARPVFEFVGRSSPLGETWAWARQDLDLATVPRARAELAGLLSAADDPGCVLIYLGAESFVDLHGLRLLRETAARTRDRGGELVVVAPPGCLRRMVGVMGLEAELPLAASARDGSVWARNRGLMATGGVRRARDERR